MISEARIRLCLLLIAVMLGASPALGGEASPEIVGRASVIDGDTIDLHGVRVRLSGIDAPESAQLCRSAHSQRVAGLQHGYRDAGLAITRKM